MERSAISDWRSKRVAVVTGGNKGIGLEVCRQLAGNGVAVVLTARDKARGEAAVERSSELEVTDARSVARLADFLKAMLGSSTSWQYVPDLVYPSGNRRRSGKQSRYSSLNMIRLFAGMDEGQMSEWMQRNTRETYNSAKETLETNYYGTKHYFVSEELKQELNDVGKLSKQRLDEMVCRVHGGLHGGDGGARGWPVGFSAYKVAKAAVNAYTRVLARRHPELRVNCVHPGFRSPASSGRSKARGNVVTVALLPTGKYFALGQEAPYV
ncbi:hypothetical protein HU200_066590 [Digitaria exilis]|uniref:Uncharacterized protein n=1 Tax=Digitaria exilis TaxID=1010633 RepID=A0A835DST3_9POAL|nr:hypothetical protein HU200_066590 [Digitaria exilis]